MVATTIHLRSESKLHEERSALTPATAKALLAAGYTINVERSTLRIFKDFEFEEVGARLVPEGSWTSAPKDHIILGLKELPEEDFPLIHTHIQFAHWYARQVTRMDSMLTFIPVSKTNPIGGRFFPGFPAGEAHFTT